ncbi:aldehyde dehydrogenase [Robbsia andropogonis]|nr:aldehyde dehydrogenase [Robbsia andropogonis]MCP1118263.1 aldehyde dehydrogenase [Robbsia andropogonis]MCP1127456.1 aldehyde dehydrogenase [Robbsia andropogonis]
MFVSGQNRGASNGATFERRNPLDGELASLAPAATLEDATAAVQAASSAFPAWAALGVRERRMLLLTAADVLKSYTSDFTAAMAAETGASNQWASFNVELAAEIMREAAALVTRIDGQVIPSDTHGCLSMAIRQPAGVVLGIAPWNAPVILGVRALATPLACGNTVVLKGSELCPATHSLIVQALHQAGFPAGVVNFLTNAPSDAGAIVEKMVADPAVRRVNFTGSTHVGRLVAQICARYLKPSVLELGGKAPALILDDADLDNAVEAIAFGAFANSGQVCMSTERIIVDESIAESFIAKLRDRVSTLPIGDPRHETVVLGSVVDNATVYRCNELISDALDNGAKLVCGGMSETTLMQATLLDRVTPAMRIFHEETFGPVKAIVRVNSEKAAIACANDTKMGLSSAVFSRDVARALRVARRLRTGICHINGPTVQDEAQVPFGGINDSGWGHFGGQAGIDAFTDLRWMTVKNTTGDNVF